jgi:O-antigen/teichoic acid export membrane protein
VSDNLTTVPLMLGKVSRQGLVVLLTRAASVVLGIASTILLSRLLGPSGFGEFRLGSVLVQLLTGFCVIGLDRALQRYLPILEARASGGSRSLLIRSSSLVVTSSLVFFVVLQLGAPALANFCFHSPEMINVIRACSIKHPRFAMLPFI